MQTFATLELIFFVFAPLGLALSRYFDTSPLPSIYKDKTYYRDLDSTYAAVYAALAYTALWLIVFALAFFKA